MYEYPYPEIGGFSFKKLWKGVRKATRSILKSKITKGVVGGLAIVYPPVGVPAAAALATANVAIKATESSNPKVRKEAKQTLINTAVAAKRGDPGAIRAHKVLEIAYALHNPAHAKAVHKAGPSLALARRAVKPVRPAARPGARPGASVRPFFVPYREG
jgi:hypothetical protein